MLKSMQGPARAGIILIVLGVAIPLVMLFFVSNYQPGAGFLNNLLHIEIVVGRLPIPYRFPLAACILLIFLGIKILDELKSRGEDGPEDGPGNKDS